MRAGVTDAGSLAGRGTRNALFVCFSSQQERYSFPVTVPPRQQNEGHSFPFSSNIKIHAITINRCMCDDESTDGVGIVFCRRPAYKHGWGGNRFLPPSCLQARTRLNRTTMVIFLSCQVCVRIFLCNSTNDQIGQQLNRTTRGDPFISD